MDINLQEKLINYKFILASGSPRRKQLLEETGFSFEIRTIETPETIQPNLSVEDQVMYLASQKAEAQNEILKPNDIVITADTIVVQNNEILGKPKSREEAKAFLKGYSNNKHRVLTGICIHTQDITQTFFEETTVYFNEISDSVIETYLNQNTFQDKAGAYGIQDSIGKWCISKIDGCYYNVMGFPVSKFVQELNRFLNF